MVSYIFYFATEPKKELVNFNLLTQERVGLNKPKRLYLLKPNYDMEVSRTKELPNSQSNDTDLNNTDNIETDNNDTYDMNDIYITIQQVIIIRIIQIINKPNLIMMRLSSKYSKNCHNNFKII